jgi:hypothetical protein
MTSKQVLLAAVVLLPLVACLTTARAHSSGLFMFVGSL